MQVWHTLDTNISFTKISECEILKNAKNHAYPADVEPECSLNDDCDEGEICVAVGDFGVAKCVDGKQCMSYIASIFSILFYIAN